MRAGKGKRTEWNTKERRLGMGYKGGPEVEEVGEMWRREGH